MMYSFKRYIFLIDLFKKDRHAVSDDDNGDNI